jgi:hypothetical protein
MRGERGYPFTILNCTLKYLFNDVTAKEMAGGERTKDKHTI